MLFLVALFLAIFVLPWPWSLVAVVCAAVVDLTEVAVGLWWNKRRAVRVGVETLVGRRGKAVDDLRPEGQVRVGGEIWRARCEHGCDAGTEVVVTEVDGLTLAVEAPGDLR